MRRFRQGGLSVALLALAVASTQACSAPHRRPVAEQSRLSRLAVVQDDNSFLIRDRAAPASAAAALPPGQISLGDNVRFDRAMLQNSNVKEIEHAEIR